MGKYRKKPLEIEAMQWIGKNTPEVLIWANAGLPSEANMRVWEYAQGILHIRTLNGEEASVFVGDYIVKGCSGEFYQLQRDNFEAAYEAAE